MRHDPAVKDGCLLCASDAVAVRGHGGIAFYVFGHPKVEDDEGEASLDLGNVVAIMVGDDERHVVDADDCVVLAREAFCGECGQVGCAHDGLSRAEV